LHIVCINSCVELIAPSLVSSVLATDHIRAWSYASLSALRPN